MPFRHPSHGKFVGGWHKTAISLIALSVHILPDRRRRDSGPQPSLDMGKVRQNSGNWVNINANPDKATRAEEGAYGNLIAGLGGAWNSRPKDYAHHHYNADINHADARKVLLREN